WAVAIQAMLKENLNIDSKLRVVQTSVWFDEAVAGNFDLAISAIVSTLMDPSDVFSAWYGKDGPQNYSRWTNPAFHDLASPVDRPRARYKHAPRARPQGGSHPQEPPATDPGGVRADLRRVVRPRPRAEPEHVLRYLRRRPLGQRLARIARVIEERHGFPGARRAWGGVGGHLGAPHLH